MRHDSDELDPLIAAGSAPDLLAVGLGSDEELATIARGSDSSDPAHGSSRFTPGALVANRFRITGLAGLGGMGEVYRADDVHLGQPVALKFLPPARELDPAMVEIFRDEVRLGRRVAHPNVCRIYDLLELEGRPAIVMELVEGEDLRSLLSRVGRLPYRRALEIARDVCAGVHAAHERGIAHGDLKPANVMIDAEGRARITDFGLARVAGQGQQEGRITGTVAYMAPEQAARGAISQSADMYSLGLVLYEIFTGSRARDAHTLAEAAAPPAAIVPPSQLQPRLDMQVENAILLCLAGEPGTRPSARVVLSAFPSRDALEAMIAAGKTPSPELVAAAELGNDVHRRQVAVLAAFVILALGALLVLSERLTLYGRASLPLGPRELAARARDLARSLGPPAPAGAEAYWFEANAEELAARFAAGDAGGPISDRPVPTIVFHYRAAPARWLPVRPDGRIGADAPGLIQRGEVAIALSPEGRLLRMRSIADARERPDARRAGWGAVLEAAGFGPDAVRAETEWVPAVAFDERARFTAGGVSMDAALFRGRVAQLEVVRAGAAEGEIRSASPRLPQAFYFVLLVATTIAGAFLARRNFRARRVDTRAASRVALWVLATRVVHILITGDHPGSLDREPAFLSAVLGSSLLLAAEVWLGYTALEPYVRRRWPRAMVTWTRLVHGAWSDRFVGHAFLFGVAVGLILRLIDHVRNALPSVMPVAVIPSQLAIEAISSPLRTVGGLLLFQSHAIFYALFGVFLLVMVRRVVRRGWLAAALWIVALTITWSRWDDARIDAPIVAAQMALLLVALYRVGVLGFATAVYVHLLTVYTPVTSDVTAIYFAQSAIATAAIALLGLGGAVLAARRPASIANHVAHSVVRTPL